MTKGNATHVKPPAHGKLTNCPFTHCANAPWMHAFSPAVQPDVALSVANFAFSACASKPFCSVNAARFSAMGPAATASARERTETIEVVESIVRIVLGCDEQRGDRARIGERGWWKWYGSTGLENRYV